MSELYNCDNCDITSSKYKCQLCGEYFCFDCINDCISCEKWDICKRCFINHKQEICKKCEEFGFVNRYCQTQMYINLYLKRRYKLITKNVKFD